MHVCDAPFILGGFVRILNSERIPPRHDHHLSFIPLTAKHTAHFPRQIRQIPSKSIHSAFTYRNLYVLFVSLHLDVRMAEPLHSFHAKFPQSSEGCGVFMPVTNICRYVHICTYSRLFKGHIEWSAHTLLSRSQ